MNEDAEKKEGADASVPPRLNLKKTTSLNTPQPEAAAPEAQAVDDDTEEAVPTIRLASAEKPRTVLLKKDPAASKKETSRIPLESARPAPAEDMKPKTIRIKPAPPAGAAPKPGEAAAGDVTAGKRKTSRIPLEAAISSGAQEGDGAAKPKTIRLKRPGSGAKAPSTARTVARSPVSLKKTSEIEVPAGGAAPVTRRKTVRVKRPVARPTVKPAAIARPRDGAAPGVMGATVVEDKPLWIFPTMAILGVIAALVLVYVQMAQVFGPDISLTRHSHGWRSLELSWPGKVVREY